MRHDVVVKLLTLRRRDNKGAQTHMTKDNTNSLFHMNVQIMSAQAQRPSKEQISTLEVGGISIDGDSVGRR